MVPLVLFLAFAGGWAWWFFNERARRKGLAALAEKYHLEVNPERPITSGPDIRSYIFAATHQRYMQGKIRSVPVVDFDYKIGYGRGRQQGTSVGVQRRLRDPVALAGRLVPDVVDGWTFLYTYTLFSERSRLDAGQIEGVWERLLFAPAFEEQRTEPAGDVSGGIVIRPRS